MQKLLLVGLGGAFGAVSRYLVQLFLSGRYPGTFPYGTFAANLIGCLLIGIIYGLAERHQLMTQEMRLLLAVGFCGSFTTFSTFSVENLNMLEAGNYLQAGAYISLSIVLGVALVFLGFVIVK